MNPIIAFSSSKGGSGKTTSVVSLAGALAAKGRSVLVVDLHPSADASRWLQVTLASKGALSVLYDSAPLHECVQASPFDRIDVLRPGIPPFGQADMRPTTTLKEAVASAASTWDFILIDTPSADERLRDIALDGASHVVVPWNRAGSPSITSEMILRTSDSSNTRTMPSWSYSAFYSAGVNRHATQRRSRKRSSSGTPASR